MNIIYILAIIFTFIAQGSFAQSESSVKNDDWFGIKGRVRAVDRWEEKSNDMQHTVRGQIRVDGWVKLDKAGCVKLNARLTSGQNYNSEWLITNLADGSEAYDINLRRLYVDYSCINEKVILQAGAMPVMTNGRLGLTDYGWVDGVRVIIEDKNRTWYLSVGEISDLKTPNVFKRKHEGINYLQAEVNQKFGKGNSLFVNVSEYEDTLYSRAGLKYAMNEYFKWLRVVSLESVAAEALLSGDEKIGSHFESLFKRGEWSFIVIYADIHPNPSDIDKLNLLVKNSYGYGKNYYFEPSRTFGKNDNWIFGMRIRDGDAGLLVETQFTRNFKVN
ncbi:MAG: hypothetical protein V4596_09060 [Bdellovibrionota bacterium]